MKFLICKYISIKERVKKNQPICTILVSKTTNETYKKLLPLDE
jgi:hypothetical protein